MESRWAQLSDDLGPEKIILIREPRLGLEGIVVLDNTAAGPALGGIRMATNLTVAEVARLGRAMTLKNAAARLRHGGGKGGIVGDPAMPLDQKERLIRAFGVAIREIVDYIPGPDMGIDEPCMAFIHDETGRGVGLPAVMGGIPLDTVGATGFGVAIAAEVAEEMEVVTLDGARVVIQGFGAVGTHSARFLRDRGASIIGVSDSRGATINVYGLDLEKLLLLKGEGRPVHEFPGGTAAYGEELIDLECDIWVPAAQPDVFTMTNASEVQTKLIIQGANIPATPQAEEIFHQRGILSIPDFIANAGGVICGAVEYGGGTERQAFDVIEEKIRENTAEVLERSRRTNVRPRIAAIEMARARVEEMMAYRRAF